MTGSCPTGCMQNRYGPGCQLCKFVKNFPYWESFNIVKLPKNTMKPFKFQGVRNFMLLFN